MIFVYNIRRCSLKRKIMGIAMCLRENNSIEEKKQYGLKSSSVAEKQAPPPKEPFCIIYITFFLIGILLLLPYNFFTTANHYWMFKFRNTTLTEFKVDDRTWWQIEFASILIIISQTTSMCFYIFVTLIRFKLNTRITVVGATCVILALFIFVLSFIFIDTDPWQDEFFLITMLTVAGINAMKSFINISIYEIIAVFPPQYLIAFLIGQGTAGIFSSVFQIASLALGADSRLTAIIYFSSGIAFVTLTLIVFMTSIQTNFYKYHMKWGGNVKRTQILTFKEIRNILSHMWTSAVIMGLVIFTILPVYPAVASLVVSDNLGDGMWGDLFFVPVTTFFLYCVSEVFGRIIASKISKRPSGPCLVAFTFIRFFLYVPALMMCNARPRRNLPVLFPRDWQYMIIIVTFGASNGYLANIAYISIEDSVPSDIKTDAFSILSTSNGIVLFLASFMGQVCVQNL